MPPEAPVIPAPVDPTILTQPVAPAPKTPESIVYPPEQKPTDPVVPPTPAKPKEPEAAKPPAEIPADPKPPTEPEKKGDPVSPTPAPVDYDLKPPAGSLVSAEEAKALTDRAKKSGLNKEQAEGLMQERNDAKQLVLQSQQTELKNARTKWIEEVKNDPIYGGDKLAENAEKARRVIDRFAPTALKQWLNETGMGDNPDVFRFVAAMASQLSEDQLVRGQTGATDAKKKPEEILYGKTTPGVQVS